MTHLAHDEKELVEKFILYPVARKALEVDRTAIELSNLKFKTQYLELIDLANFALQKEMRDIRKAVIDQEIKPIRKSDLDYDVIVRGYTHSIGYHPNGAKEKIDRMLNKFFGLPI